MSACGSARTSSTLARCRGRDCGRARRDEVGDEPPIMSRTISLPQLRLERRDAFADATRVCSSKNGTSRSCSSVDQAGAQAVVEIVIVVGDLVGEVGDLRFERGCRRWMKRSPSSPSSRALLQRAVLEDALARFERQVRARGSSRSALRARRRRAATAGCARSRRSSRMHALSASCPAWPNGVWPRSCARQIASASVSFSRSARAIVRAICATSIECVSRVRYSRLRG